MLQRFSCISFLFKPLCLESFLIFEGKYSKQKDCIAMGSPLDPTLANLFLCHFQEQWMSDCPIDYQPVWYSKYVQNKFLLFSSEVILLFTIEREENNSLAFLDVKLFRNIGKFQTSIYRKPTVFYSYRTNIIFFPFCYIVVLWFALLMKLCILKFWN